MHQIKVLEQHQRYFLKKADRLKSRKLIDKLFKSGKSFSVNPFKVIWLAENKDANLQTGVGVSSRNFKRAVDRNRIKRLMREAYRLQKNALESKLNTVDKHWSVFVLYTGKTLPDHNLVYEKFTVIINKLLKVANENFEDHS